MYVYNIRRVCGFYISKTLNNYVSQNPVRNACKSQGKSIIILYVPTYNDWLDWLSVMSFL